MNKLSTVLAASALLLPTALPASGQTAPLVNKTWVSSTGSDTGSCQLAAPCKTFAYAIGQTNSGGEIDVKDSGAYGAFTIAKSIAIVADGVVASVGSGANHRGIDIESANAIISIRGLVVDTHDFNEGENVFINASDSIVILDHLIIQQGFDGVSINGAGVAVAIKDSLITSNYDGISINNNAGRVSLSRDLISGNYYGLRGGSYNSYSNNEIFQNVYSNESSAIVTKVAPD